MQRLKKTFCISLIALGFLIYPASILLSVFTIYTKQAYATVPELSAHDQSAITKIINKQTATGSIVSEHLNKRDNGQTIVKMLEIPENQLTDIIVHWEQFGHEINGATINDKEFIKYLINNSDMRSFSYTAEIPKLYFLVKHEIAEAQHKITAFHLKNKVTQTYSRLHSLVVFLVATKQIGALQIPRLPLIVRVFGTLRQSLKTRKNQQHQ